MPQFIQMAAIKTIIHGVLADLNRKKAYQRDPKMLERNIWHG